MIEVRSRNERGKTRTGWLDSSHTFSFNRYYDPRYMGFRALRVINEDRVAPAKGFGTHSHQNMEILSYVVEGVLEHRDSSGGSGVLGPNELQRMTAGTGVSHSEYNPSKTNPTHFLQIWILPEREGLTPAYEQREFPVSERQERLRLIASRNGADGSVTIHQDARVYDAIISTGVDVTHTLSNQRHAWVQIIKGAIDVNGVALQAGDGAAISEEQSLRIAATKDAEILLFDLA